MATQPFQYQPVSATDDPTNPQNFQNTSNPKTAAQNARQMAAQTGAGLMNQDLGLYNENQANVTGSANYLNNIEDPLAQGQGGYNASELSQINMTPQQQQQMVTGAGISAGTNTAAATDAAQRATAASGGNPAAEAAYRARAASNIGAQAGDAQTQARVAASNAAAGRQENIGQTRIGQQNEGLNYYQQQNAQSNQNAQNALGLQSQAYGTQTQGVNGTLQAQEQASQNPNLFTEIAGGVGGALSFLDDGGMGEEPAVVGEAGPEAIVSTGPGTPFARHADGGYDPEQRQQLVAEAMDSRDPAITPQTVRPESYQDLGGEGYGNYDPDPMSQATAPTTVAGNATDTSSQTGSAPQQQGGWFQNFKQRLQQYQQQPQSMQRGQQQQQGGGPQQAPAQQAANQLGAGIGHLANYFLNKPSSGGGDMGADGLLPRRRPSYMEDGGYADEPTTIKVSGGDPKAVKVKFMADGGQPSWKQRGQAMGEPFGGASPYRAMGVQPARVAEMFSADGAMVPPGMPPAGPGMPPPGAGLPRGVPPVPPVPQMPPPGPQPSGAAPPTMGTIITRPTKVMLGKNDAVVPLGYRAKAKIRPSMAMPLVNSMRKPYGARV